MLFAMSLQLSVQEDRKKKRNQKGLTHTKVHNV